MRISRDITLIIHHILDQWLPPFIRDSRLFMYPVFRALFGSHARTFMDFKARAGEMSKDEIRQIYLETARCHIHRETDINLECLDKIDQNIIGNKVLDIACGRGHLAARLAKNYQVTAADFSIDPLLAEKMPHVVFKEVDICSLPFDDDEFDTVICAHTLEHIQDIARAVSELRRVAGKRIIIIVPRQRPYKYTFDLHLHFFPYSWSLEILLNVNGIKRECSLVGGDWFYVEDLQDRSI